MNLVVISMKIFMELAIVRKIVIFGFRTVVSTIDTNVLPRFVTSVFKTI